MEAHWRGVSAFSGVGWFLSFIFMGVCVLLESAQFILIYIRVAAIPCIFHSLRAKHVMACNRTIYLSPLDIRGTF